MFTRKCSLFFLPRLHLPFQLVASDRGASVNKNRFKNTLREQSVCIWDDQFSSASSAACVGFSQHQPYFIALPGASNSLSPNFSCHSLKKEEKTCPWIQHFIQPHSFSYWPNPLHRFSFSLMLHGYIGCAGKETPPLQFCHRKKALEKREIHLSQTHNSDEALQPFFYVP